MEASVSISVGVELELIKLTMNALEGGIHRDELPPDDRHSERLLLTQTLEGKIERKEICVERRPAAALTSHLPGCSTGFPYRLLHKRSISMMGTERGFCAGEPLSKGSVTRR